MALHIDEMNIQARNLISNQSLIVRSHDDPENLANSMLVFLMTSLTGKKKAINLCSKTVHNLKAVICTKFCYHAYTKHLNAALK